jgi:hypothetical protein
MDFCYIYVLLKDLIVTGGPQIDENYFISLRPSLELDKF